MAAALCKCFVSLALVALVSFVSAQEFQEDHIPPGMGRALNDNCSYDGDCRMQNVYCDQQQHKCVCKRGFKLNNNRNDCIATVGVTCQSNQDCASLPNSLCTSNLCVCKYNYVPHPEEQICLERKKLGEHCKVGEQCHTQYNFNAHCINEVCVCREDHHESMNKTCIQSKSLGQSCIDNMECYIGDEYLDKTQCRQNTCICKPEFPINEDGKCGSGAPGTQVWSSVMTLAVMASVAKIIAM
uniref:Putative platelet endothelial aggregation receptor 1-like isoform x2 n=1 Tax=Xenopsylla cheopis TaxID=163159 RepID=A0A6M2DXU4_XENCH